MVATAPCMSAMLPNHKHIDPQAPGADMAVSGKPYGEIILSLIRGALCVVRKQRKWITLSLWQEGERTHALTGNRFVPVVIAAKRTALTAVSAIECLMNEKVWNKNRRPGGGCRARGRKF
jgi:hypothetical protein